MTNTKKTQRKNKTNLVMNWPSHDDYFTIKGPKGLMSANPDFIEITLRVRLKKAIDEDKTVKEIGTKNTGNGRPVKVFAMMPVNPLALEKAKADGILLESQTMPVIQVTSAPEVAPTTEHTVNVPIHQPVTA